MPSLQRDSALFSCCLGQLPQHPPCSTCNLSFFYILEIMSRIQDHSSNAHSEVLPQTGTRFYRCREKQNWNIVQSYGSCLEMSGGVIQVGIQWVCFTVLWVDPFETDQRSKSVSESSLVLYMIYYPEHLKYVIGTEEHEALLPRPSIKGRLRSVEWRLSIVVAWITGIHLCVLPDPSTSLVDPYQCID